MRAEYKKEMKY